MSSVFLQEGSYKKMPWWEMDREQLAFGCAHTSNEIATISWQTWFPVSKLISLNSKTRVIHNLETKMIHNTYHYCQPYSDIQLILFLRVGWTPTCNERGKSNWETITYIVNSCIMEKLYVGCQFRTVMLLLCVCDVFTFTHYLNSSFYFYCMCLPCIVWQL